MTNFNTFRKGNFIRFENCQGVILNKEEESSYSFIVENHEGVLTSSSDWLEPIYLDSFVPLKEMGFLFDSNKKYFTIQNAELIIDISVNRNQQGLRYEENNFYVKNIAVPLQKFPIRYVHELQNFCELFCNITLDISPLSTEILKLKWIKHTNK